MYYKQNIEKTKKNQIVDAMKKYSYDMTIGAASQPEADRKIHALAILCRKLNTQELEKLADVVQHDPLKTKIAKKALGL